MEKFIENQPPVKKLKQATLPFFKTAPVKELNKNIIQQGQGKKRRNSNSLDSATKCSKTGKPLVSLDSPNSKAAKIRKLSVQKPCEENGNEVSSSSEADSVSGKSTGKCCLLDRFVTILPADAHQEISSTNEVLDLSVEESELAGESSKIHQDDINSSAKATNTDNICIIIDDSNDKNEVMINKVTAKAPLKAALEEATPDIKSNSDAIKEKDLISPNSVSEKKEEFESDIVEKDSDDQNLHNVDKVSENTSFVSEDDQNESLAHCSFMSQVCSTPLKVCDQTGSEADLSPSGSGNTKRRSPKTPSSSNSKARKSDPKKKAELAALKQKQKEEKEKERLERKRKLEEEKAEKEKIKMEKREAKEREKQEKLEKDKAREEERKKREDEKLKKQEEKMKKQAALESKLEEKKRKEEERKQREEEKVREDEEKKKKEEKTKQVFQKFFIKPKETPVKQTASKPATGIFIPFEVKKDMHLAPAVRRQGLSIEKKEILDQFINNTQSSVKTYLQLLKNQEIVPQKTGRILRKNPQPSEDVEIIHDSEALKKVFHQVKLLQFHTDYRPPYYGTWRKQPKLFPRNPWKKDESLFDYEVDSDDEWEEEEPGESLSCSDGEEEKGEEVDEDEDDGWMVPHGYLSEDEGCNEDDEITPEKLKLQQLAKAKAWEEEQKRKHQVAPLITVGCFFQYSPSASMCGDVRLLYEFRAVVLALQTPIPTGMFGYTEPEKEEVTPEKIQVSTTPKGFKKKSVPDEAMQDLIRLVHGNTSGIKRLVREFRVFWLKQSQKSLSDTSSSSQEDKRNDSLVVTEKESAVDQSFNDVTETEDKLSRNDENKDTENVKEEGYGCCISKRQLELKILSIAVRERREGFKKICWYVHENILSQFSMSDIKLPNSWVYLSITPAKNIVSNVNKSINIVKDDCAAEVNELERQEEQEIPVKPQAKDQRSIKDFALSKEELAKKNEIQAAKAVEISNLKTNMLDSPKENKLNIAVENSNLKLVVSDTPKCVKAINKSLQSSTPKSIVSDTTKEVKKSNNQRSIMEFAKKPKCGKDMLIVTSESKIKMAKCSVGLEEINTKLYYSSNNKTGSRSHESDCILITDSEDSAMSPFTITGDMTDTDAQSPSSSSTLVNCDKGIVAKEDRGIEAKEDKDNEAVEEKCIEAMDVDSIPKLQNESLSTTEKVNVDSIIKIE